MENSMQPEDMVRLRKDVLDLVVADLITSKSVDELIIIEGQVLRCLEDLVDTIHTRIENE